MTSPVLAAVLRVAPTEAGAPWPPPRAVDVPWPGDVDAFVAATVVAAGGAAAAEVSPQHTLRAYTRPSPAFPPLPWRCGGTTAPVSASPVLVLASVDLGAEASSTTAVGSGASSLLPLPDDGQPDRTPLSESNSVDSYIEVGKEKFNLLLGRLEAQLRALPGLHDVGEFSMSQIVHQCFGVLHVEADHSFTSFFNSRVGQLQLTLAARNAPGVDANVALATYEHTALHLARQAFHALR